MNKQLVNVIGGAVALAIVLLGVVVFALPLYSTSTTTSAEASRVANQNSTDQARLDALTAQAADTRELDDAVADLRAQLPETARLDDVLQLAVDGAAANGATVTAVTKGTPEAFAVRVAEGAEAPAPAATEASGAAGTVADGAVDAAADAAEAHSTLPEGVADESAAATASADDGPQQITVTVTVDAPDVAAATRVLDALRAGPRLVAVITASVTSGDEGRATLTATLLAFSRP